MKNTILIFLILSVGLFAAERNLELKPLTWNNPITVAGPTLPSIEANLNESFEGTSFPPAGWVKHSPDGGTGWTTIDAGTSPIPGWTGGTATAPPGGGSKVAFATWNTGGTSSNEQWLVSAKVMNVSAADSLSFWLRKYFDYADTVHIKISTTDSLMGSFSDFATIGFGAASDTSWARYSYSLASYAGNDIYVAFVEQVADNFNNGDAVFLDMVRIVTQVSVTFQVDMSVQILEGAWNPVTDSVVVAGSFNGWNPTNPVHFTDPDVDSIYTGTWTMDNSQTIYYKFVMNGSGWEGDPNREANIGTSDTTLPVAWFNRDSVVTLTGTGDIEFSVDMTVMDYVGIYDQVNDSLQVRGSFNGWGNGDPMNQDFLDPNLWSVSHHFDNVPLGDQYYKFYVDVEDTNSLWTDGWERPSSTGGGNRTVEFTGATSLILPTVYYDDIHPDWIIEDNTNLEVTFNVDMRPATDPLVQPVPFDPAADTLWWICEQPSFVMSQGWVDTDEMRVLQLTDANNDTIFSGTLMVLDPGFNSFMYRYAFSDVSAGSWTYEPSGYSNFAYRVRYAGQDLARSFPVNPWDMPVDTWTNAEIKTDQETDPFTSYTGVDDPAIAFPEKFALYQNYPNPFNPTTNIKFDLPKQSDVKLVIYNVLGQEVITLVDDNLKAGDYAKTWNGLDQHGNRVATGVYFYKLVTNEHTAVKKLVIVK